MDAATADLIRASRLSIRAYDLALQVAFHGHCTTCCQDATTKARKARNAHKRVLQTELAAVKAELATVKAA